MPLYFEALPMSSLGSIETLQEGIRVTGASMDTATEKDLDAQIQVPRMHLRRMAFS